MNESEKTPKASVFTAKEPGWAFTNSAGGTNVLLLVSQPLPRGLSEGGLPSQGYPWESLSQGYFCNMLSLDKREHRVRSQRPGGHRLLSRVVYVAVSYYPEFSALDN